MKKIINVFLLFFSVAFCFAQTSIVLKETPFEIKNQQFYIDNVIDDRKDICLGVIADASGKEEEFYFQNKVSTSIKKFINTALTLVIDKVPITLRIQHLKIEEAQTSIDKRTARVYIELHFYAANGTLLHKVAHYENQIFPVSNGTEIKETHEKRIRAALEYCFRSFIDAQKENTTNNLTEEGMLDHASSTEKESTIKTYVPLGKWFNMLTFKRMTDRYNKGWNVSYTGFSDHEKNFIIPFVMGYGQSSATSDILKELGFRAVDSYKFDFGFNGFIKITPGFYVDLGLNVPIGLEVLKDLEEKKSTNFLIGLSANQGVKIIPWKDFGIVIGAGVFQRWQTSKVINRNFGFQLEVGINF